MHNEVTLIGNLGRDPEIKHTQKGTAVCNLSLATSHRVKRGEQWEDETEWHRVTVWGKTAENVARFCKKGKQLFVKGRIQTRSYERGGEKRYATEVVAELVKFLGGKGAETQAYGRGASGNPAPYDPNGFGPPPGDDDIPF